MFEGAKDIDIGDVNTWPNWFKVLLAAIICIAIVFATYWFKVRKQQVQLEKHVKQEQKLKEEFIEKNALAANLDAYREQKIQAEKIFNLLKEQLPNKNEIPDLLENVTQHGLSRGLQFQRFQPAAEVGKDFYVEKPVNIVVTGSYHELAAFVSDVAEMPRIVSVDDFSIDRKDDGGLKMTAVTKTYYYNDDGVQPSTDPAK